MNLVEGEDPESAIWYSTGVLWNNDWDVKAPSDLIANYAGRIVWFNEVRADH
jgi:hypothetical protein